MDDDLNQFINDIPKAELHIHIEGSLEPELMFKIARHNKLMLPHKKSEELRMAYNFTNLQSFLDIYYEGTKVLQKEKDFYDLTMSYLQRAHSQNVRHTEIFFDPQTHTDRGIPFETVITGMRKALMEAKQQSGISSKLIMCFLRHLSAEAAMDTLEEALPYKDWIVGVGLDSTELGNPPVKFKNVFDKARVEGFLTVAHAGEEGPPEYIWQALEKLKVSRIDHGVRCIKDAKLVEKLQREQIPLTICPLANVKLGVFKTLEELNLKKLLDLGLLVSVNSDDPAYFGGYVAENFIAVKNALSLDKNNIYQLARNSFNSSFLTREEKRMYIDELDNFMSKKIN